MTCGASRALAPRTIRPVLLPAQMIECSPIWLPSPMLMRSALRNETLGAKLTPGPSCSFSHLICVRVVGEVSEFERLEIHSGIRYRFQEFDQSAAHNALSP